MSDEKKNTMYNNAQQAKKPDNTISNEMRGTP